MKTKALYLTVALATMLGFSSCKMDFVPGDELSSEILLQDPKGAEYIMDGCYAVLKDEVEFLGYSSANCYVRHYMQMSEFPADNICLSAHTTDPLYEATAYMMNDGLKNVGTLWMIAYKVIYMTNTVIETLDESNQESHQLLGEAYFMRGLMHFHLVTLFAKPYTLGRDNLGVPLRTSTASDETKRASVGQVYDQVVKDLRKAADLMGPSRGNAGYPCKDAALGVLSRVYLYMGEDGYDNCIATVDEALNGASPESKLEPTATFPDYFANAKTSKETLFCIAHETTDDRGQGSIGSMYIKDGIGWGEIYPSDPLMYLYERYPSDVRYTGFLRPQYKGNNDLWAYLADPASLGNETGAVKLKFRVIDDGMGNYSFKDENNNTVNIEKRPVKGEYFEYHANYGGKDCLVRVEKEMVLRTGYTIPMIFVTKFSYQDGNPMLSSPVFCRWGEVILNRAEAYAHKGQVDKALADVNVIRKRAGIPDEGMFSAANMHGYTGINDPEIGTCTAIEEIVYDERRLELAFEGHRMFDVYRNKLNMDRRYAGAQPWKVVPYTEPHIQYPIPNNEWTVSGIEQNPGY
ncbi:MAG: RagB/SusD family nutrient uptake outer membrane protein [Paludibacteraceae bacterium]|nr:RagB/SusD family nutrient uptake outer membrane protein [Paludibacteraceae bacterium]